MLTPRLFEPIVIGGLRVKNRFNMPPMHTNLGNEAEGITDAAIDFLSARAKGGFGLIGVGVIDAYFVHGAGSPLEMFLKNDVHVKNYARCIKEIEKYGSVPYAQLGVRWLFPFSELHKKTPPRLSVFSVDKIEEMIQSVIDCAVRAADAGFRAVDILGIGGSAHSLFLSEIFNDRNDEWGGSPERRLQFGIRTVRGIKKALGEDYPVFYRLHGSEFMKGGYGVHRAVENAQALEAAGVRYFNVAGGGHATSVPQLTPNVPQGAYAFLAAEVRKGVSVPVAASVRNTKPFEAEAILRNGWADMISFGRQSLADADWPNKVAAADYENLRLCIGCNECLDITIGENKPIHCLVNPRQGVISEVAPVPQAQTKKKVAVIGGGVTGLQAALTAAERGHRVILFEKKNYLGGMWHQASQPSGREELFSFLKWLVHSVKNAGVDVRLGEEATDDELRDLKLDAILVAAGSEVLPLNIPGVNGSNVVPAISVINGDAEIGQRVAIVGGGGIGVEIATHLARRWTLKPEVSEFLKEYEGLPASSPFYQRRGHDVTLITRQKRFGGSIGSATRWVLVKELEQTGVKAVTGAETKFITEKGVGVVRDGAEEFIEADTVLIAAGLKPNTYLFDEMKRKNLAKNIYSVGDPDLASHAVHTVKEAYKVALKL